MDKNINILFAEDDRRFAAAIKRYIMETGWHVTHVSDGEAAWLTFQRNYFDLCLIDSTIPKVSGLELAELIRKTNDKIPIILIAKKSNNEDVINGFKHGADDYILKSFSLPELMLRMKVFLKRTRALKSEKSESVYQIGIFTFRCSQFQLLNTQTNKITALTKREAELLLFLCQHSNRIISRECVLFHVWGKNDYFLGRSMDVYISRLRKRLSQDKRIEIRTIHGVGLIFIIPKH